MTTCSIRIDCTSQNLTAADIVHCSPRPKKTCHSFLLTKAEVNDCSLLAVPFLDVMHVPQQQWAHNCDLQLPANESASSVAASVLAFSCHSGPLAG